MKNLQLMQEIDKPMLLLQLCLVAEDGGLHPSLALVDELILAADLFEDGPDQPCIVVELPRRNDLFAELEEYLRQFLPFADAEL